MSIGDYVFAAVIAGALMAVATEAGYRLGIIRGNLLQVDGEFALNRIGIQPTSGLVYAAGMVVHLVTSAIFGMVLYAISKVFDVDATSIKIVGPYVFVLWLAMLFSALPVAGQGFMGRKLANSVWMAARRIWAFRI